VSLLPFHGDAGLLSGLWEVFKVTIETCRECGKVMSNDLRGYDEDIDDNKIFCKKCRARYKRGLK
jgi:hypothetical protein